jgi:hypothetical protein
LCSSEGQLMRNSAHTSPIALVALTVGLLFPARVSAGSIVLTQASLDWSGFSFTVDGGLVIDSIESPQGYPSSGSFAQTQLTGSRSAQGLISAATSSSTNDGGAALAHSSTSNGLLQSASESSTFGDNPSGHIRADGDASAFTNFFLYGHGSGYLTVSVPYTLEILVNADELPAGNFRDDFVSSAASASLILGPGTGPADEQWFDSTSVAWLPTDHVTDRTLTKTGTLTVSRSLVNPTFGPLIFIGAVVRTEAVAAVPEPGELLLFASGLATLIGLARLDEVSIEAA